MKYSKQLRLLRKPGWILHYVDYELLRRYCNEPSAAFTQHMDNDERGCCDGGGAPATTAEVQVDALIRGLTTEQAQAAFLGALRGELPSPLTPPQGCVFHTRCPLADAQCRSVVPPLREIRPGHMAACVKL